jgi:hypothetical protein
MQQYNPRNNTDETKVKYEPTTTVSCQRNVIKVFSDARTDVEIQQKLQNSAVNKTIINLLSRNRYLNGKRKGRTYR